MPAKSILEPWKWFFTEIDNSLHEELALHCLGGFVMTMLYGLDRPTADVDVLPLGVNSATESLMRLAGEGSARTFTHLRLFALDPFDLALSKIERNTQRDRDDVKYLARTLHLDLDLLKNRYEKELRPDLGNPRRENLTLKLWIEAIEDERLNG